MPRANAALNSDVRHVIDRRMAAIQTGHAGRGHVDSLDVEAGLGQGESQRQADVPKSQDGDAAIGHDAWQGGEPTPAASQTPSTIRRRDGDPRWRSGNTKVDQGRLLVAEPRPFREASAVGCAASVTG